MKLDPKSQESKDLVWKLFKRGHDFSQWLYQLDDDVVVEMSNYQEYIISDINIHVFMDRFKQ